MEQIVMIGLNITFTACIVGTLIGDVIKGGRK